MKTNSHSRKLLIAGAALSIAAAAACGSDSSSNQSQAASAQPVAIAFKGLVGGDPFNCASTYAGIGSASAAAGRVLTPKDFRFYVHDVRLVDGAGAEVPVSVTEDGLWQHAGVTLIDFEDRTGTCTGSPERNDRVVGTVPPGTYRGLRFRVGVPPALNHLDVAAQPSPLNLTGLYWVWVSGYRFTRIEGMEPGAVLHLGSAGCTLVDANDQSKGSNCTHPNRPEVDFPEFDAGTNRVVVDLSDLWSATDLTTTRAPSGGCMSNPADVDCAPVFPKLGLPFGDAAGGAQTLFKKE